MLEDHDELALDLVRMCELHLALPPGELSRAESRALLGAYVRACAVARDRSACLTALGRTLERAPWAFCTEERVLRGAVKAVLGWRRWWDA